LHKKQTKKEKKFMLATETGEMSTIAIVLFECHNAPEVSVRGLNDAGPAQDNQKSYSYSSNSKGGEFRFSC